MNKILTPRCDAHRGVEFFELCDEYLGKIETERIDSNQEKTGGRKSRDTLPLRKF